MKGLVVDMLARELKLRKDEVKKLVEVPPQLEMGDYAFPCFGLAKVRKVSPLLIAESLAEKFRKKLPKEISGVDFKSGYVNFFVDKKVFGEGVLKKVKGKGFGKLKIDDKKIGLEYPAPNTNKALHVGHLRNMAIGESVYRIARACGNKVYHLNLFNDRGILISKAMNGYEKWGKGRTPEGEKTKGDKFVGDFYVRYSLASEKDKKLEVEAQEKLKLWEGGDKKTLELWKKLNSWTYSGMDETFEKFGLSKIDKNYYESEMYLHGKEIVDEGLKKSVFFKKKDGAVVIDLEEDGLGEKILLRADGTSLYVTQDLYLAEQKIKDFNLDSSYYVVGGDQIYHFKVLFSILEKLGLKKDWKHLSYGMVRLPSGRMKSREGSAVFADDVIEDARKLAEERIVERQSEKISKKELGVRSLKVALAALKYNMLKVDIGKNIVFDPASAVSFEGDTGPYLLYSYARANSICRRVESRKKVDVFDLKDSEVRLLKKIDQFEDVLRRSYENLAPNLVANYCFELAKDFNEFYHDCPVLGSIEEGFRLRLVDAFRVTLEKGLDLLGIEVLEEM